MGPVQPSSVHVCQYVDCSYGSSMPMASIALPYGSGIGGAVLLEREHEIVGDGGSFLWDACCSSDASVQRFLDDLQSGPEFRFLDGLQAGPGSRGTAAPPALPVGLRISTGVHV